MALIVLCPECGNTMKYAPKIKSVTELSDKRKRCVYCGHTFKVHPNVNNSRIVGRD